MKMVYVTHWGNDDNLIIKGYINNHGFGSFISDRLYYLVNKDFL